MLNTRLDAAQRVATPLFQLEAAIDAALSAAATLQSAMTSGRSEARLSAIVGQDAFDGLGRAQAAIHLARRHVVDTHIALDETRAQVGLPVRAFGDEGVKPPRPTGNIAEPVRSVA